ncbi:MAG: LEA type 2 family protein [Myxococcales bacterium]|nr:LEA type 2 family protein [Myxococcales bacterium]
MRRVVPVLVLSLAGLAPGCKLLEDFFKTAFQQPSFTFKDVALTDISLGGLTLDTVWQLDNPNSVGLSLAAVDYALFIDSKQVLAGAPAQGLQIPAKGSTDLHFPAGIKFLDLAGVVETFLTKDNASWRAEGSLGLQTPVGIIKLPLAKEGTFEVPKVPQVAFGNPRVSNVTLQGATIEFPLTVTNRNTYALPIGGVTGTVSLAGAPLGTLSTGNLGAMDGKGTRQVALPLSVNFFSAGLAVARAVQGNNAQVSFNAQVQSGATALPLKVDQLVNLVR